MALNDAEFIQAVIDLQDEMIESENYEASKLIYAQKLLAIIKNYLMSGTVIITGTSNQGAFTGTGNIE
ncbi:hypothetical protein [Faecalibacter bovis]|uniref:Uncharacterized protein n=1 Tax=Faecalibacter bovis TaxID=2898187 RepID=A0ABX7XDY1_9FLAO|nr:hypothetical protein [Faecalibacter bovis]QTV06060.1 hypothetical protein J9309_01545 [Faecalibacter bovis]